MHLPHYIDPMLTMRIPRLDKLEPCSIGPSNQSGSVLSQEGNGVVDLFRDPHQHGYFKAGVRAV